MRRPESNFDEVRDYSQHRVDYLDLATNRLASSHFIDLARETADLPLDMVASQDRVVWGGRERENYVLTFDGLLSDTPFVGEMREMLAVLEKAYSHPVDIEFTVNFLADGQYRINLLQCRPLQVQGTGAVQLPQVEIRDCDRILELHGPVIGPSRLSRVDRVVYVSPRLYGQLPLARRHAVARLLGAINQSVRRERETLVMLGPGRWGTSSPELGIPVQFSEICHTSVLCEIVAMRENLVPDVSLGTHFFNELVEMNTLYTALFPARPGNYVNEDFFLQTPNRLVEVVPNAAPWQDMVRLIDTADVSVEGRAVLLLADVANQEVRIFLGDPHLLANSRN